MVNVRKRGNVYEYNFDVAKIEGKRKRISKSGFKTKAEALKQGTIAYNEYLHTGRKFISNEVSYSDFLDYWLNNHCVYYAFLTAYCTGLRIAEVFALTWDDIDLNNKTITVNKNILKKNQVGRTKGRHLSGNSTTVWYFGTCKTQTSYRIITIGDTLINALKEYKEEQEMHKQNYGDTYMKHYKKNVINPYNNKPEIKIVNAYAEIDVALPEVNFIFVKNNGVYEGTDNTKYPFKIIHKELGIENCRFYDLRGSYATINLRNGIEIRDVADILGHKYIETTENFYISSIDENKKNVGDVFDRAMCSNIIEDIIKYEMR